MERRKRTALNAQTYEEAGEWFLEFRDGEPDAAARSEFDLWVRRSPDHLAAYLEIAAIWNEAPALESPQAKALIARALQDLESVIPLSQLARTPAAVVRARRWAEFPARHRFAAASFVIVCVGAVALFRWASDPAHSTGVGEQRTIALQDGSRIELNSRSKVKIRYSDEERGIDLVQGQALFSVAKDPARPFVVSSGNARVRAVGTQFDVYRKSAGTVVTVVEGQVAVRDGASRASGRDGTGNQSPVLISAGQQLVVTQSEIKMPVRANVANVTAWTQHQLAFDAAALSEVAEEFNRYNERQLVISDRAAFEFRISGVFSSSDPAGLIHFLRDRPGIRVLESPTEIVIEKAGDANAKNNGI